MVAKKIYIIIKRIEIEDYDKLQKMLGHQIENRRLFAISDYYDKEVK